MNDHIADRILKVRKDMRKNLNWLEKFERFKICNFLINRYKSFFKKHNVEFSNFLNNRNETKFNNVVKFKEWLMFKTKTGSHAYGTFTEKSDEDFVGIFLRPLNERVSLINNSDEYRETKLRDLVYYELEKFMYLASKCNPNIIELFFMPDDCVVFCDTRMEYLLSQSQLFVTKKAYHTFSGYAYAQIQKAKGANKWINNPKSEEKPKKENFCWIIFDSLTAANLPMRPVPLKDTSINLSQYHVAALEHVSNTYRLYWYGFKAGGVFRDGNLVCESIPLSDENDRYRGLLIYNKHEYEKEKLEWENYWKWMKERNPNRWKNQEDGLVDYDTKNMMHCLRLLLSGEHILKTGEPIIRFEGQVLQLLKDVRDGLYSYDVVMTMVDNKMKSIEEEYNKSKLPWGPDMKKLDSIFKELVGV